MCQYPKHQTEQLHRLVAEPPDATLEELRTKLILPSPVRAGCGTIATPAKTGWLGHRGCVCEATLSIFRILKSQDTRESLAQAAQIIADVQKANDLNSSTGEEIALQFVAFHLTSLRRRPPQDRS